MVQFEFIGVRDYGETCCPHCGAEGRYIYEWKENGVVKSAMSGCYRALTGHLNKGEKEKYFELLFEKIAKGKKLNGWDKSVRRLLDYKLAGKYPESWCDEKINEVLRDRKSYLSKHKY